MGLIPLCYGLCSAEDAFGLFGFLDMTKLLITCEVSTKAMPYHETYSTSLWIVFCGRRIWLIWVPGYEDIEDKTKTDALIEVDNTEIS